MHDLMLNALDALPARVDIFVRDDDAGWDDAALLALLDITQRCGVPIDLAAIPRAVGPALASELCARMQGSPALVHVHQHGYAHFNHERDGRKCEFGPSRSAMEQRQDLSHGQTLLREHFGARLQAIFTPPWNRCTECTPALLAELGFAAVSRNRGAKPAQHALQEIAVDVDWTKHLREGGEPALAMALTTALQARAGDGQPFGLMLHHAVMSRDERLLLVALLMAIAHHPHLRWRSMGELLAPTEPQHERTPCITSA